MTTPVRDESALYDEAQAALRRGDLKQASALCQQLLEQLPVSARGYHLMSSLFQATGHYRKAYDYAALATQMDDCVAQYHLQQGHVLYALASYEQAFDSFTRAAELNGNDSESRLCAGHCMKSLERYDEAHHWYEAARKITDDHQVILAEAECYLQAGEYDTARNLLSAMKIQEQDMAEAEYLLAMCALSEGDIASAKYYLEQALIQNNTHSVSHFYMALIALETGDTHKAIRQALEALRQTPTHIPSLILLGNIFLKQGDENSARKAFSHIKAIAPEHLLMWQGLIQLYDKTDRLSELMEELKQTANQSGQPKPLKYLQAICRGDVPSSAPREYIVSLYQNLVESFDYWLLAGSDDRHLKAIAEQLQAETLSSHQARHLSLLDVGCNTGEMAAILADRTAIRVGVELSPDMAKLARRSKQYDVVYELDATDYVMASETQFDVVTIGGALRWVGNLQPFFHALRNVMHEDSVCAFVVSKEPSTLAYTLLREGRYQHNAAYIQDIMQAEGYYIVSKRELVWLDSGDGVSSRYLFIIKKTVLH